MLTVLWNPTLDSNFTTKDDVLSLKLTPEKARAREHSSSRTDAKAFVREMTLRTR